MCLNLKIVIKTKLKLIKLMRLLNFKLEITNFNKIIKAILLYNIIFSFSTYLNVKNRINYLLPYLLKSKK